MPGWKKVATVVAVSLFVALWGLWTSRDVVPGYKWSAVYS